MTQSGAQTALPAGYRLEQYTLVRQLSVGGFSVVYLALDDQDNKFAIKEYFPLNLCERDESYQVKVANKLDQDAFNLGLRCFFEEGRVLSGIQHPNVVHVTNFFRANQTVYMVMTYEEGRTLARELENGGGNLTEKRIRKLFAQVAAGLREVHLNRLLHLDVKPANIYLRRVGAPLLLDFGAARETLLRGAKQFASMYTPGYAAPEQYNRDSELGPWTDIYAVGACLYACMNGAPPPPANERLEKDAMAPAAVAFADAYSKELADLTDQCLALKPEDRPPSLMVLQKRLLDPAFTPPPEPGSRRGEQTSQPVSRLVDWFKNLTGKSE
jgi:serine/threonine protein kinase